MHCAAKSLPEEMLAVRDSWNLGFKGLGFEGLGPSLGLQGHGGLGFLGLRSLRFGRTRVNAETRPKSRAFAESDLKGDLTDTHKRNPVMILYNPKSPNTCVVSYGVMGTRRII